MERAWAGITDHVFSDSVPRLRAVCLSRSAGECEVTNRLLSRQRRSRCLSALHVAADARVISPTAADSRILKRAEELSSCCFVPLRRTGTTDRGGLCRVRNSRVSEHFSFFFFLSFFRVSRMASRDGRG